jgi:hypothetical protein
MKWRTANNRRRSRAADMLAFKRELEKATERAVLAALEATVGAGIRRIVGEVAGMAQFFRDHPREWTRHQNEA